MSRNLIVTYCVSSGVLMYNFCLKWTTKCSIPTFLCRPLCNHLWTYGWFQTVWSGDNKNLELPYWQDEESRMKEFVCCCFFYLGQVCLKGLLSNMEKSPLLCSLFQGPYLRSPKYISIEDTYYETFQIIWWSARVQEVRYFFSILCF